MKHLTRSMLLTGAVLFAVSVAQPSLASDSKDKPADSGAKRRVVYYITSRDVTGSNIPMVVRRYQGHNEALSSPLSVYSHARLEGTGASDVGAQLTKIDPAISAGRGLR